MTRFNSLLGPNKFPVPMRRELARKSLNLALDSEPTIHSGGPCEQNTLYISQLAGNLGSETSSHTTASSSEESANSRYRFARDDNCQRRRLPDPGRPDMLPRLMPRSQAE